MNLWRPRLRTTVLAALISLASFASHAETRYMIATATPGGTYYPVGVALSTLIKVKLLPTAGIDMSAVNSAGSEENVSLLIENRAQFAIMQSLFGVFAVEGTGPLASLGAQQDLRSIASLWPDVEHFVIPRELAKSGNLADFLAIQGAKVSLGRPGSGVRWSTSTILTGQGIAPDDAFQLVDMGYDASADALLNGTISGMSVSGGPPVAGVTRVMANAPNDFVLLNVTAAQASASNNGLDVWTLQVVPAGTYPGQTEDVTSLAQPNILVARADVSDDDVYQITKSMFENLHFLRGIHAATEAIELESALDGLAIPLHPGAARYFEEAGVTIPDHLQPPQ